MNRKSKEVLKSIENEINQLEGFLQDLKILSSRLKDEEYLEVFEELNAETDRLRVEYSIVYSQILTDYEELKELVQ